MLLFLFSMCFRILMEELLMVMVKTYNGEILKLKV